MAWNWIKEDKSVVGSNVSSSPLHSVYSIQYTVYTKHIRVYFMHVYSPICCRCHCDCRSRRPSRFRCVSMDV